VFPSMKFNSTQKWPLFLVGRETIMTNPFHEHIEGACSHNVFDPSRSGPDLLFRSANGIRLHGMC